jgi:hypothetical protein
VCVCGRGVHSMHVGESPRKCGLDISNNCVRRCGSVVVACVHAGYSMGIQRTNI